MLIWYGPHMLFSIIHTLSTIGGFCMNNHISPTCIPSFYSKFSTIFLAFCWCAGLVLGCCLPQHLDRSYFSLMHKAVNRSVSIVGLFAVLLPFLISAIAVYFSQTWLVFPICFIKAFSFAFVAACVTFAFGPSGWLVRVLLLFTDFLSAPVVLGYWLRLAKNPANKAFQDLAVCAAICAIFCSLDYFIVSPFLTGLIYIS